MLNKLFPPFLDLLLGALQFRRRHLINPVWVGSFTTEVCPQLVEDINDAEDAEIDEEIGEVGA